MILLFVLHHVAGMTGVYHQVQLLVEMGSHELLLRLASNSNPPSLNLPSS
jgi:hypothetical protein